MGTVFPWHGQQIVLIRAERPAIMTEFERTTTEALGGIKQSIDDQGRQLNAVFKILNGNGQPGLVQLAAKITEAHQMNHPPGCPSISSIHERVCGIEYENRQRSSFGVTMRQGLILTAISGAVALVAATIPCVIVWFSKR